MRNKLLALAGSLALLAAGAGQAVAITGNYVQDFDHPYVGLLVLYDSNGDFLARCSGSLLSPTVLLTAGHCAGDAGAVSARVYFQQDAGANYDPNTQEDPITGYPDTCAGTTLGTLCATSTHLYTFGYTDGALPETHDAGIVVLDQAISMNEYGQLPTDGLLTDLATARGTKDTTFTTSGYGLTYKQQTQNGKPNTSFRSRLEATETLTNLRSALNDGFNLQLQGNGDSRGGSCNGDSGGPVFLGGFTSDLIVGIDSFGIGNTLCRGTDFYYRTDRQAVLDWIEGFLE